MESTALVSIIIPTFNHARFITQAVESALAQSYPRTEVIVVDDGSTDQTRRMLSRYGRSITYLYQENKGPSAARNTGILAAQGDYLLFVDADDLIPPEKIDVQLSHFANRTDTGIVYSAWQYVDEQTLQVVGEMHPAKRGNLLKDLLRRAVFFPPGAAIIRRQCLEQAGPFDEELMAGEDTDMWIRIAQAGYTFDYVDRPLFQYRMVKGSLSRHHAQQERNEFARLDKFFANPALPAEIKALRAETYSILHYEFAAKYLHHGPIELGQDHLRQAITMEPALAENQDWLLNWLAGYVLDQYLENPRCLMAQLFDHLPPEAQTLQSLRRRAYGRYHVAAVFSAYHNRQFRLVRQHILPALLGDPSIIKNRGFLRIAVQSILPSPEQGNE